MRAWWAVRRARLGGDDGNSVIEFLGLSLILLIPLVYLVLTLGRLEAATFATEGAAREAARTYVGSDSAEEGTARAVAAVGIALRDQGFHDDPATALTLTCSALPCLAPGSDVSARIEVRVPLPFVPSFVRDVIPLEVPVSVERVAPVDTYRTTGE